MNDKEKKPVKIAMVDDHEMFRDGLRLALSANKTYHLVIESPNGAALLEELKGRSTRAMPDVLLLDIEMPVMNGVETASLLRDRYPFIKVVVLTMHTDMDKVTSMLRQGVAGYVTKNARIEDLMTAIDQVNRGKNYFSPLVYDIAIRFFTESENVIHPMFKFSARELQIIHKIVEEKTSDEIARALKLS
jgi:two-component system nitrate/nitrite response regulator NarL